MRVTKRRLSLLIGGLGAAGAAGVLSLGATSALYSSTADPQHDTITTGTVTLASNAPVHWDLNLMPGDSTTTTGATRYALTYSGSADAFVGLAIHIKGTADQPCNAFAASTTGLSPYDITSNCTGTGQVPMFNGISGSSIALDMVPENGATAHQLLVSTDEIIAASSGVNCGTDSLDRAYCEAQINHLVLPRGSFNDNTPYGSGIVWQPGNTDTVYFDVSLPLSAPNTFQGSTVAIDLTGHAVQYVNNNTTNGALDMAPDTELPSNYYGAVPFPKAWS